MKLCSMILQIMQLLNFRYVFMQINNIIITYIYIRFLQEALPLYDLAMLGLYTKEAGWTEEDGPKEELATSVKELLLEKADMLKEYFSIVIDKKGNLKSLPVLLGKYILINYP